MTLFEEVEEILDNYLVMKNLADVKMNPLEVNYSKDKNCFLMSRKNDRTIYQIHVSDDKIRIDRNHVYVEYDIMKDIRYQNLEMTTKYKSNKTSSFNVHGMVDYTVVTNIEWTLYDIKSFETFLLIIDSVV